MESKKSPLRLLKSKDICQELNVSDKTARNILKDIKLEYKIKYVTYNHFLKYLKIN